MDAVTNIGGLQSLIAVDRNIRAVVMAAGPVKTEVDLSRLLTPSLSISVFQDCPHLFKHTVPTQVPRRRLMLSVTS